MKTLSDQPTDGEKFRAQVEAGKVFWESSGPRRGFLQNACKEGLHENIDMPVVDPDMVSECGLPSMSYAFKIAHKH